MTTAIQPAGGGASIERPTASSLADVLDTILDKGLVIDAYVRVSLVGIELLTIDARIVIASVDTYLRFAEAVNRLDISNSGQKGLPDLIKDVNEGGGKSRTKGALEAAGEKVREFLGDDDEEEKDSEPEAAPSSRRRKGR
jgi:hypothetical protein